MYSTHVSKLIGIALVAANGVIGDGFDQPLRFAEDFANFKKITAGHPLIVGRRTFDAMGWLPGRKVIVVTSRPDTIHGLENGNPGERWVRSNLPDALELANSLDWGTMEQPGTIFIGGGANLWRQCWEQLDELMLSIAYREAVGSVKFPKFDELSEEWMKLEQTDFNDFDLTRWVRKSHSEIMGD